MRCNQVSIDIERFGKYVPENYPADVQRIHVYCDDFNSIYAALSKAYALAINELAEYERIGARTDVYTNEFSRVDYREMNGALPETKRKYEEDVNLQYYNTDIELCEDRIWVYEHADEILETLRECEDQETVSAKLKDKFGLNDYQIRKLSQMRFDMLTKAEYLETKKKMAERKEAARSSKSSERSSLYRNNQKLRIERQMEKIESYFKFLEHYEEIMKIALQMKSTNELENALREQFEFSREEASAFKYFSLNDFSKENQEKKAKELARLKEDLKYYTEKE